MRKLNPANSSVDLQSLVLPHPLTGRNHAKLNSVEVNILSGKKMDNRPRIFEAFGRVVFLSHIIEDRLKMHIFDCAFFSVGCMAHFPHEKTRKASFENLIDYYRLAHHDRSDAEKIWRQLHLLRQIRNQLVHGFVLQIHDDLQHEEGRGRAWGQALLCVNWPSFWASANPSRPRDEFPVHLCSATTISKQSKGKHTPQSLTP